MVEVEPVAGGYHVTVDGRAHLVEARRLCAATLALVIDAQRYRVTLVRNGQARYVAVGGEFYTFMPENAAPMTYGMAAVAPPEITAPMPGKILRVLVGPNDHVAAGDVLLVLEAMKMEHRLLAEAAGTVRELRVAAGDMVDGGQVLAVLTYDE
ncbi:MAG: biotin/lipoyl-containing protein [Candidatus Binatia bacterium]